MYSPPQVDTIEVYYNEISIYFIFYLYLRGTISFLNLGSGDYQCRALGSGLRESARCRGTLNHIGGSHEIKGTILGVLIKSTIEFWGLYWGPLILGNYHMSYSLDFLKEGYLGDYIGQYYRAY